MKIAPAKTAEVAYVTIEVGETFIWADRHYMKVSYREIGGPSAYFGADVRTGSAQPFGLQVMVTPAPGTFVPDKEAS